MSQSRVSAIKRAQKESVLLRKFSQFFHQIALDDPRLQGLFVNRVKLANDKSVLTIYFMIEGGKDAFEEVMPYLVLYKPSLRAAIAKAVPSRYTPELVFAFDEQFEKQKRLDDLLNKLKSEGQL